MEIGKQLRVSGFSILTSFPLLTGTFWFARSLHWDNNSISVRPECSVEFSSTRPPPEWPSIKIEMLLPEVRIFVLETNLLIWQIEYVRRNHPNIKLHVCQDEQMSKGDCLPSCGWSTDYLREHCVDFGEVIQYVYRLSC